MERQRHTTRLLEYEMENKLVKLATTRRIEKHARDIYTPSVFLLVQDEICRSSSSCYQKNSRVEGDKLICVIQEKFPEPHPKWDYQVEFNDKIFECDCSCLLFVREGRLCRHVFVVYYINEVHAIPDRYILKRWSKGVSEVFNSIASELNPFVASYRVKKELLNKFRKALFFLKDDTEKLELLRDKFDVFISEFFNPDDDTAHSRFAAIEQLYGFPRHALANVHGPKGVRNKGERSNKGESSNKRYLPAVERNGKKQRACKKCGILGHKRRSCDKRNAGKQKMKLVDEDDEDDEDYDSMDEQLEEVGESQD
ncbi:uncharacterized protein [Rutidosis leptorrhynchoides]|uniref:uncharacterized protein n=1 Tax=Rutidosis leptorrhynchoides TaxID=125765 RepID=UPI003A99F92A